MTSPADGILEVTPPPTDGVTRVQFSPSGTSLLVAGWSGELALHSSQHGTLVASVTLSCPLLDASYGDEVVYAAALDGTVYSARVTQSDLTPFEPLGVSHACPVSCVATLSDGIVVSGSWDGTIGVTDTRAAGKSSALVTVDAGAKVFDVARVSDQSFGFVTSEKRARVVDVRKPNDFVHDITPSFGAPLRCLDASPQMPVLVLGSTDGRIAVETLDSSISPSFAFKCHRQDGRAYPVNAICHNKKYGSFASGGGDGHVSVWDGVARKRIFQYPCAPTSISSLDFGLDDSLMVVAVSYTFEEGERDHAKDTVYIRNVHDSEIRPKEIDVVSRASEGPNEQSQSSNNPTA